MTTSRREFLKGATSLALAGGATTGVSMKMPEVRPILKPKPLKAGDLVGLVNPAGATYHRVDLEIVGETLQALGLRVRQGRHVLDRRGYFAGRDEDRAADLNEMFADDDVAGIVAVRGGWGCARILPRIDFAAISKSPKALLGYSDITALHLAIFAKTGLVTFHGPVGISKWNSFSTSWVKRVLFNGEAVLFENPHDLGDNLTQIENRVQTIHPGMARGRLLGGNLTVLTTVVGSGYLPDWEGAILFLEDTGEQIYRIDRMLTQLKLAGILDRVAGFVFGKCTDCDPGQGFGSLTLEEVFDDHIRPLGVPAWQGAMIGHIDSQFTLPLGVEAEIDADKGTIRLLESAVARA